MSNILMCGNEPLGVLQGNASDISFTPGGGLLSDNVQDAIIELDTNKVDKSGDTMTGYLYVDNQNGTTSTEGFSYVEIGNSKAIGTDKNSTGVLKLYGDSGKYVNLYGTGLTDNRNIGFPNQSGRVCLLESLTTGMLSQSIAVTAGHTETTTIDWTGVDKSKVLYSWVWWSNSLDDVPTFLTPYYNGTYTPAVNVVHHQWKTTQQVNLKICYILKG